MKDGGMKMKEQISTIAGIVGGFIAMLLGGWDSAMITLVIFMAIDFTTGMIAAALGKSKHSWTGRLSSKAGWYGLAKKFCTLLMTRTRADGLLSIRNRRRRSREFSPSIWRAQAVSRLPEDWNVTAFRPDAANHDGMTVRSEKYWKTKSIWAMHCCKRPIQRTF